MDLVWLYWILALPACGYVMLRGGPTGMLGGAIMLSGSAMSLLAALPDPSWIRPQIAVFWIDVLVLIAFGALAFKAQCFWPLWATSFQGAAVTVHLAKIAYPATSPKLYQAFLTFWSLPILISIVVGVALDERKPLFGKP
jgi:hypothetical protein